MSLPGEDGAIVTADKVAVSSSSPTPSRRSSTTNEPVTLSLPRSSYFIIFVEGCERFCFFGLRTILLLYFMYFLKLNSNSATVYFHLFLFACHVTPTLGAVLSDGFIGRYLTIVILSIVYFIGTFVLTITSIPTIGHGLLIGPIMGLLLIALGTGGIKPCVNTFGADQISISNPKQLNRYFSFFYFSITIGAFLSMILIPIIRSNVNCFGYDCYSLAFGIPSALILIAIILFLIGTPLYKRFPPQENIIAKFISIIFRALRNGICKRKSESKEHWLDYADDKYSNDDIEDVQSVLHIFVLFAPLAVYHALNNQQGSRWTYQASLMDGSLGPFGTIQPDQMQAANCILVLALLPLFDKFIYPEAARLNWFVRPLQRIFFGLIVMILAFVVAAILQNTIDKKAEAIPVRHFSNIYNGYNCPVSINSTRELQPEKTSKLHCSKLLTSELFITATCDNKTTSYKVPKDENCPSVLIISEFSNDTHEHVMEITQLTNPASNSRGVREYASLRLVSLNDLNTTLKTTPNQYIFHIENRLEPTEYQSVLKAKYRIDDVNNEEASSNSFYVQPTAVYTVLVNTKANKLRAVLFVDVPEFTVHILWQTIQYVLISIAEILVTVTCLTFAYSQGPKRYKVVIMSAWLLTSALGDLLVIFVARVRLTDTPANEFILFAVLMAFATFIFGAIAVNYKENYSHDSYDNKAEEQRLLTNKNTSS